MKRYIVTAIKSIVYETRMVIEADDSTEALAIGEKKIQTEDLNWSEMEVYVEADGVEEVEDAKA